LIGKRRNTESQELDKEGEPQDAVHDPEHAQADAHPRGVHAKSTIFI